ncbi:cell wall hydrolase [Novosphingobium sp.]|uniref:cell wall hydrolase n=1 Tax=Novosphingobium sp. TaxID=1874826 RepID=UPI003D11CA9C
MSYPFRLASALGFALSLSLAVFGTSGAKARPQDPQLQVIDAPYASPVSIDPKIAVTPATTPVTIDPATSSPEAKDADIAMSPAVSLAELVNAVPVPETLPQDIECMAGAVYFEARSESLAGQLAVGRVIVARTASGRFPESYCGVVMQHAQFSFIHGCAMPVINRTSHNWLNAVRIALIAHRGTWKSPAEGALFFHAARIHADSGKTRIAQIDNHVFYR